MVQLGNVSKKRLRASTSSLKKMDELLKSNTAWKGSISMQDGASVLSGQIPYTYILSTGVDKYHYLLHYVGADHKVHFKNIRILFVQGVPIYRNGGGIYTQKVEDLIPGCLKCSSTVCKPLS